MKWSSEKSLINDVLAQKDKPTKNKGKAAPLVMKTRLILEKDQNILLLRQTKHNGGAYTLVGGKVEAGETAKQSLIRESWEESGIILQEEDLSLVHVLHKVKNGQNRLTLFFSAFYWRGEITARERHKFKKLEWCNKHRLPESTKPKIKLVLARIGHGHVYTEV